MPELHLKLPILVPFFDGNSMSRDYTQEVGLSSSDAIVPLRYALPFLAGLAILAWCGMRAGLAEYDAKRRAPKTVTAVQIFLRE
jgi:hypothetical protein